MTTRVARGTIYRFDLALGRALLVKLATKELRAAPKGWSINTSTSRTALKRSWLVR